MTINQDRFIDLFADKTIEDQTSVFVGAGISAQLGLPTWKELLTPCATKLGMAIDDVNDYYALSQYYANTFGKNALKREMNREFQLFQSKNETLDTLLSLEPNSIWTTNYDTAIEDNLQSKRVRFSKVHDDHDLANISSSDTPIIYKLNGDIHNLENIILTKDDWENYEHTHPTIITFLKRELVSNTFLFLGYSFSDNLITKSLSDIRRYVGESSNYHYTIMKNMHSSDFEHFICDLEKRYHIKTVLIEEYSELPEIISSIRNKVIERNIFISGRLDDQRVEVEEYACELCRVLGIALLKRKYNICTGMGRKIGYFIAGPAIQYLLEKGIRNFDKRIRIRPFDDTMSQSQATAYREHLIDENHIMIFIFGQKENSDGYTGSYGVKEEFYIAKRLSKIIIPIGSTGFESESIWNEVKANIIQYPYLEGYIEALMSEKDATKISRIVLDIVGKVIQ